MTMPQVPGVYYERRKRTAEVEAARTDVVGFVGFDPRVRDGSTPSSIDGTGHAFRVDVGSVALVVGGERRVLAARTDFVLSESATTIPVGPGQSIAYALAVVDNGRSATSATIHAVAGSAHPTDAERAPNDAAIGASVSVAFGAARSFVRLADVHVRRDAGGVTITVRPAHALALTRCDDYRDYVLALGEPADDGTFLGAAVRAFFANGGKRCWVATVRRPSFTDSTELGRAREDFVGVFGASEAEATGLERLLLVPEVTAVDVPDLYAVRPADSYVVELPPLDRDACFHDCGELAPRGSVTAARPSSDVQPLYGSWPLYAEGPPPAESEVFATQRKLVARALHASYRMLVLLSVPLSRDDATGRDDPPTAPFADAWRRQFHALVSRGGYATTEQLSCAALYWPWVVWQKVVGEDRPLTMPPSAYAAGVLARRDLARGPAIAPAGEVLRQVVAMTVPVTEGAHASLYEPERDALGLAPPSVNVVRAFSGKGALVWGARTLSTDRWLKHLSVRRTLTAVQIRMHAALQAFVFEPSTTFLWLRATQAALGVLLPMFQAGVLRGDRPEEAFYVRCDSTVNTPDDVASGRMTMEVGVAAAAPAEFIVFRIGRRDGVVEVLE